MEREERGAGGGRQVCIGVGFAANRSLLPVVGEGGRCEGMCVPCPGPRFLWWSKCREWDRRHGERRLVSFRLSEISGSGSGLVGLIEPNRPSLAEM